MRNDRRIQPDAAGYRRVMANKAHVAAAAVRKARDARAAAVQLRSAKQGMVELALLHKHYSGDAAIRATAAADLEALRELRDGAPQQETARRLDAFCGGHCGAS